MPSLAVLTGLAAVFASAALAQPLDERTWQKPTSRVDQLFKRQSSSNNSPIGSPEWLAKYPPALSTPKQVPQEWLNRLYEVTNSSYFPTFGPAVSDASGTPKYATGVDPSSSSVCSFNSGCRAPEDIWNAPDGELIYAFDDGPTTASPALYDFLEQNNLHATHYMIGGNVRGNIQTALRAIEMNDHIAIHTWSHPHMTTKTNEEILAEIGWTAQILYDANGGRVPLYWRPPYGDTDNRVRMIAKEVFGLECVIWNQDSDDWAIGNNPKYTLESVEASITSHLTGSKSPGLIILEHELNDNTVQVFMTMYPKFISNGWNVTTIAESTGSGFYQNAWDNRSPVTEDSILQNGPPTNLSKYEGDQVASNSSTSATTAHTSSSSASSSASSTSTSSSSSSSSTSTTSSSSSTSRAASTSAPASTTPASASASNTTSGAERTVISVGAILLSAFAVVALL